MFDKTGTSESNPPNLEQQLDYLIYELNSSEKRALAELESFKKRYSTLVELEQVFRAIEEL